MVCFFFSMWIANCYIIICWKDYIFSSKHSFCTFLKNQLTVCMCASGLSGLAVLSHWPTCLSAWQFRAVLSLWLYNVLLSGRVSPELLFCLSLAGPFSFPYEVYHQPVNCDPPIPSPQSSLLGFRFRLCWICRWIWG